MEATEKKWNEKEYVLLADNFSNDHDGENYVRGDRIILTAAQAAYLGPLKRWNETTRTNDPMVIAEVGTIPADEAEAKDEMSQLRVDLRKADAVSADLKERIRKIESGEITEDEAQEDHLKKLHQGYPTAQWPSEKRSRHSRG